MKYINKSKKILNDLQLKNGGILATPINGAYPYVYTRDAVIITKALNKLKMHKKSKKFYNFINKFSNLDQYGEIFHRYNKDGLPCVTRKHEHDNPGLVLHGIYDTYLCDRDENFLQNMWPLIEKAVEEIFSFSKNNLIRTERSIHEFYRLENGYEIWANSSCIRGLYDAAEMAKVLNHKKGYDKWRSKAKKIEDNMKKKLFYKKLGIFIKNTKYPNTLDISQLAPFYFDLVDNKKVLQKTMKYLNKHIWNKEIGGFRRFRKFEVCKDWHWYTGGSGSWCVFTAWGARFYRKLNDKKNYNECMSWLEKTAKRTNGLLPEHVATKDEYDMWKMHETEFNRRIISGIKASEELAKKLKDDVIYWATPLGWSHAEYILLK